LAEDFTQRILYAAQKSIPETRMFRGKRKLPYWNDEIKNKIVERKKSIKLYRNTLNPDTRMKIGTLTIEIKELLQRSKTDSWRNYTNSIINHKATAKEIYDKIRTLNGTSKNIEIKKLNDANGIQTTDQTEILNIIKDTFQHIYSDDNLNNSLKALKAQTTNTQSINNDIDNETYNDDITAKELEEALIQTKGSSPGHDKIHYDMLKNLTQDAKNILLMLYNKAFDEGLPQKWKHSIIIPIKKPGKDPRYPTYF
jgi:hypothetical protein